MEDWLRFSPAFWHTFRGAGDDPFGSATRVWPWETGTDDEMVLARRRMHAMFELLHKLGLRFWAFHDRQALSRSGYVAIRWFPTANECICREFLSCRSDPPSIPSSTTNACKEG